MRPRAHQPARQQQHAATYAHHATTSRGRPAKTCAKENLLPCTMGQAERIVDRRHPARYSRSRPEQAPGPNSQRAENQPEPPLRVAPVKRAGRVVQARPIDRATTRIPQAPVFALQPSGEVDGMGGSVSLQELCSHRNINDGIASIKDAVKPAQRPMIQGNASTATSTHDHPGRQKLITGSCNCVSVCPIPTTSPTTSATARSGPPNDIAPAERFHVSR